MQRGREEKQRNERGVKGTRGEQGSKESGSNTICRDGGGYLF